MSHLDGVMLKPQTSRKSRYRCHICQKFCESVFCLRLHMRCHEKRSDLRCSVCHLSYRNKCILNSHFRQVHLRQQVKIVPHCTCCGQKFDSLLHLKEHLMSTLSQFPSLSKWLQENADPWNDHLNDRYSKYPDKILCSSKGALDGPRRPYKSKSEKINMLLSNKQYCSKSKSDGHSHSSSVSPVSKVLILKENFVGSCRQSQSQQTNSNEGSKLILNSNRDQQYPVSGHRPSDLKIAWNGIPKGQCNTAFVNENLVDGNGIVYRKKEKNPYQVQNQLSSLALKEDSDSCLDDSEFIGLLHTIFEDDSSDGDSEPPENPCEDEGNSRGNISNSDFSTCRVIQSSVEDLNRDPHGSVTVQAEIDVPNFKENNLIRRFLQVHTDVDQSLRLFKCLPCKSAFSNDIELFDHMRLHICLKCGASFEQTCELTRHGKEHESDLKSIQILKDKFDSVFTHKMFEKYTLVSDNKNQFTCILCAKSFHQRFDFFLHMYTHAENPLNTQTQHVSPKSLQSSTSTECRKKDFYTCTRCNKIFKSENTLREHIKIHDQRFKLLCSVCGQVFQRSQALLRHSSKHVKRNIEMEINVLDQESNNEVEMKSIHWNRTTDAASYKKRLKSADGQFVVTACYTPQKLLPDQNPLVEMRERIFSCPDCDKMFFSKHNLRGHLEVHNPQMRFFCSICSRGFRRKTTMKRHSETHTKNV